VDDRALIEAWRAGDTEAGRALFARYYKAVTRFFINKISDRDAAADLVQRTFLAAVESAETFRGAGSFRSFLFTIAHRQLYRYFGSKHPAGEADEYRSVVDLQPSPPSMLDEQRESRLLLEALQRLPLPYQVVLELCFWEDMTGTEIAVSLELPVGTVRTRLRRGKQLLLSTIERLARQPGTRGPTETDLASWAKNIRDALDG
jgi:RNA polymerase sigma-70 factor, ECF subfamily